LDSYKFSAVFFDVKLKAISYQKKNCLLVTVGDDVAVGFTAEIRKGLRRETQRVGD